MAEWCALLLLQQHICRLEVAVHLKRTEKKEERETEKRAVSKFEKPVTMAIGGSAIATSAAKVMKLLLAMHGWKQGWVLFMARCYPRPAASKRSCRRPACERRQGRSVCLETHAVALVKVVHASCDIHQQRQDVRLQGRSAAASQAVFEEVCMLQ